MTECTKVGVCVCKCECVGLRTVAWEPKSTHTFYVEDINAKLFTIFPQALSIFELVIGL